MLRGDTLVFDSSAVEAFKHIHDGHGGGHSGDERISKGLRFARVIAVTSGKGGVGKTNISLNLAIELQRLGRMCVVLDADMGLANVHLLAGINPRLDIMNVISENRNISEIITAGPEGIGIIPGGAGMLALADSSSRDRKKIVKSLKRVEEAADIIIVDTGAGMGPSVRDFLSCADELLFVLTSDITSLADAYALLKVIPRNGDLGVRPVYSVVNMVGTLKQASDVSVRFSSCARQFLGREIQHLGYILRDSTVGAATAQRTPYTVFNPQAKVSINTRNIAAALLKKEMPEIRLSSSFNRYMNMIQEGEG
ncbi:MAG: AAA family ATPase [Desulfobulbaceae bacterium]|nr:AAA family ATPase [Desulfobulbaceae bacterium]